VGSSVTIPGPAGPLEARLDAAAGPPRAAVVFAHPHPQYGGTMHTKVVFRSAQALARIGCVVLRFNFRGVGASRGAFDGGPGEMDDFRAALDFMAARHPDLPLWAAGMSFGAWVALEVGAADDRVALLLAIAPPVDRYAFTAVRASRKPKFLIHGEADDLVPLQSVWRFYGALEEPKELVVIDAADHLFDGKVSEVADAIEDLLGDYDAPAPPGRAGARSDDP
jgi:alpha/beta superfamily hydrolase